ncbi:AAA family ATPase [Paradevosia shaoguanensis]|uniref:AAA family ATPase n=1 Tax=Paradevosia shaoguanensis TaxID=1335043 RepID=A0AA41QL72_9HYPH|nr:AAA family ATPase [Paradevosia shaoguanensis]MCF1742050.1 AAA family ATPase [Paradevosia shaoguanensis]MCI0126533.1 AAA family ATPase [Paradevosia shaoguanensis]
MPDDTHEYDDDAVAALEALAPVPLSAEVALSQEALSQALSRGTRTLLKQPSLVIVVEVPSRDWVGPIGEALPKLASRIAVKTADELQRANKSDQRVGASTLQHLQAGRTVAYVSQDPEAILDEAVLAAADATIVIPPLTAALLRKVIRRVSKQTARGVTAEMAELPLPVILSAIRPGLPARASVANLTRALEMCPAPPVSSSVPLLSDLPLTSTLRSWTDQTMADLAAVRAGTLPADQLVYGVLEGAPGTGKTLLAESLARTAGWSFVSSTIGNWFTHGDGALGGVARNIKDFVDAVLAAEPCIGYLDELDGLPDRATMDNRARDWWTPIVNLVLVEIDRLRRSGKHVLLLGGTNFYTRLDAALVRPGRLQRRVTFLPPQDADEVIAFLRHFLADDLADTDLSPLVRFASGATPAAMEGWVKEARACARAAGRPLQFDDLLTQIVPEDTRSQADIRAISLHEVGHALVAHRLGHVVETLSIIPTGRSAGYTRSKLPGLLLNMEHIRDTATVMLGGRAADIVLGNGAHTGAEGDLEAATRILLAAYERQGLNDSLLYMPAISTRPDPSIVTAVAKDLRHLLDRAITMVNAERELAYDLADRLIASRILTGKEVADCLGDRLRPASGARRSAPLPDTRRMAS